jgi:hypothetical protein
MRPVSNERTVLVYKGPATGIGDPACERVRPGVIRSFWLPTAAEREKLAQGGVVELVILGEPIPPVALNALTRVEANEAYEADGLPI